MDLEIWKSEYLEIWKTISGNLEMDLKHVSALKSAQEDMPLDCLQKDIDIPQALKRGNICNKLLNHMLDKVLPSLGDDWLQPQMEREIKAQMDYIETIDQ